MEEFTGDCWLSKVETLKNSLGLNDSPSMRTRKAVNDLYKSKVQSKFDRFWLEEVNQIKLGPDGKNNNKLRFYNTFKGTFACEPYIEKVRNRNQRHWLTRLRISAHHLQIEVGRWASPPVPVESRLCKFCDTGCVDDEMHFLWQCPTFSLKKQCFLGKLSSIGLVFGESEPPESCVAKILCPTSGPTAVCTNKYIGLLFKNRKLMDEGCPVNYIGPRTVYPPPPDLDLNDSTTNSILSLESICSEDLLSSKE